MSSFSEVWKTRTYRRSRSASKVCIGRASDANEGEYGCSRERGKFRSLQVGPHTASGRTSKDLLLRRTGNNASRRIEFSAQQGEMIAIVGPSGTGKSTLLHLLAALDTPTSGDSILRRRFASHIFEAELAEYRNHSVGFVWQRHHLLPDFTAAENVAMPLLIRGRRGARRSGAAKDWLGEVGLANRARQRAGELSGGEQQRVAIARALVNQPTLTSGGRADRRPGRTERREHFRVDAAPPSVSSSDFHLRDTQFDHWHGAPIAF